MPAPPSLDIAIVNYFGADDVRRCLLRLGPWPHGTVWIVDNSNDGEEFARLSAWTREMDWVRLLAPGENIGFGRACNLAFERSSSELFLLLNPDAIVAPADLRLLAATLAAESRIGAASPRIYWNEARTFLLPEAFPQTPWTAVAQTLGSRVPGLTRWTAGRYLERQRRRMASRQPFEVSCLAGAVMVVRRAAVEAAGGLFDPDYFMFYEDSDLSLRLRRSGWRLAVVPAATAVHEYRHKPFKADLMSRSRAQFFRKRYPAFFRLSGALARLDRLARPVPADWCRTLPAPCRTLADFAAQTDGAGVLAWSPSMLMVPAIFRPLGTTPRTLDESEWALLEPGDYMAVLAPEKDREPHWLRFQRTG